MNSYIHQILFTIPVLRLNNADFLSIVYFLFRAKLQTLERKVGNASNEK